MTVEIRPLLPDDRSEWEPLWEGYQRFYEVVIPAEITNSTWRRFHDPLEPMHAIGAFDQTGKLIGIAHVVFHRSTWMGEWTCYLQDLFVGQTRRGKGVGEALIEAVASLAREKSAERLYWVTHETNTTARKLYDRVASRSGFIQYRKPL